MLPKILIVDDVESIHALIKIRLKDERVEWRSAYDADSGLEIAGRETPDLILMDIDMPGRDGFAACAALKSNPATSDIPLIFLTASDSVEQKVRGLELGALDYVAKPFEPAELRARVRNGLRLKFMMDLLARKASVDGLTGLWNRIHFDVRLIAETSLARRRGSPLSCIMLDVDRFKQINDRYGHPFGDEVLRRIASILTSTCRQYDICCRYGGEEFIILCPDSSLEGTTQLAERLRINIESEVFAYRSTTVAVSCSFGVAAVNERVPPSVLELVDAALYRAKGSGRNCVVVSEPGQALLGDAKSDAA